MRVCFATPGVIPLLSDNVKAYGGSELRALRFIRGLSRRQDMTISVISFSRTTEADECRLGENVAIFRDAARSQASGRFSRLMRRLERRFLQVEVIHPRVTSSEAKAWKRASADAYVTFGVGDYTAQLVAWGNASGRPVVLMLGSDLDVSSEYKSDAQGRNIYGSRLDLCAFAVLNANAVVAQTKAQQQALYENFAREGAVIPAPMELRREREIARTRFLWVGKRDRIKRPELCIELARRLPHVSFRMIVNGADQSLHDGVPGNVTVDNVVANDLMPQAYAGAIALLNTSMFEGMPNSFLEAGVQGTPVVSLSVDPDDMLHKSGGGVSAHGDLDRMTEIVKEMHLRPDRVRSMGEALHQYVSAHHGSAEIVGRLAAVLQHVVGRD